MAPNPRDPEKFVVAEREATRIVVAAGEATPPIRGRQSESVMFDDYTHCPPSKTVYPISMGYTNCSSNDVDLRTYDKNYDPKDKRRAFRKFINKRRK